MKPCLPLTGILSARLLNDLTSSLLQLRRELIGLPSAERRVKHTAARLLDSGRFADSAQLEVSGRVQSQRVRYRGGVRVECRASP